MTKSKEEFFLRLQKGKADHIKVYSEEEMENLYKSGLESLNKVYDPIMEKYVENLRRRIESVEKSIIPV